ncbi:MAG: 30S ribosomal protein S6 [Candidatus Moraniibacteriota bacterium]
MQYEIFYLVGASKEAALETIKSQVEATIKNAGGIFLEKEILEKRKLAYAVQHESHGFYLARRFDLEEREKLQEINKKLNLYPEILRFILSRAEDLPEMKTKEERIREGTRAACLVSADRQAKEADLIKKEASRSKEKVSPEKKPRENQDIDSQLKELLNI